MKTIHPASCKCRDCGRDKGEPQLAMVPEPGQPPAETAKPSVPEAQRLQHLLATAQDLGEAVQGLLVSYRGYVLRLSYAPDIEEGRPWLASGEADDPGDFEMLSVCGYGATPKEALEDCADEIAEIENPQIGDAARPVVGAEVIGGADRLREVIGAPQIECGRCDLLGRVFGDYARAFTGAAAMLGLEAPEDVTPARLLAQLRVTLQKRREAEAGLQECASVLAKSVEANKAALEQFRRLADLMDRGDVERARVEIEEVIGG